MNYFDLLNDLKLIVKKAGENVLGYYDKEYPEQEKEKFPVTKVDFASNKILLEGLSKYEDVGILSEETKDDKSYLNYERIFIIDSLDGTKDFVHKTGDFSIMVALVENNYPVIGVVYKPIDGNLYYAIKSKGAFSESNGEKKELQVSNEEDFSRMKLVTSRFHLKPYEIELKDRLKIGTYKKIGSAGLKMAKIAEGAAQIYLNTASQTGEWDTAVGTIIVEEAGGRVTDVNGERLQFKKEKPYNLNGFVVSSGMKHDKIISE